MRQRAFIAAIIAALGVAAIPAAAGSASKPTIKIVGGPEFKINAYAKDTMRFKAAVTTVKSGGTVTVSNASEEPHSVSIVKKGDLPRTAKEIMGCFEDGPCGALGAAHEFPEGDGPPGKPVVDGGDGINKPGDSVIINPKGAGPATKFKVTAKKGTTLHYFCGLHPWMQARLKVN